jgi:hypothetical protein
VGAWFVGFFPGAHLFGGRVVRREFRGRGWRWGLGLGFGWWLEGHGG